MNTFNKIVVLFAMASLSAFAVGCSSDESSEADEAAESIGESVNDVRSAVKDEIDENE